MKTVVSPWLWAFLLGCGSTHSASGTPPVANAPTYAIHEWGVITTSSAGTLVSAGPPSAAVPMVVVEKPVLYIHTSSALAVQLEVQVGAGFDVPEHYPPSSHPQRLQFRLHAVPGACPERHAYPLVCSSPDGLCEIPELSRYETTDAACLRVGEHQLPLLFYRLGATGPVTLPGEVRVDGSAVSARATGNEVSGWRVALVDGEVRAAAVTLGEQWSVLPTPNRPWTEASAALDADLRDLGLTEEERAAFQRAWRHELFGAQPPSGASDVLPAEETQELLMEEQTERTRRGDGPVLDVLIYFMAPEQIDRVARIVATPAPSSVSRAFVVRHVL